MDPLTAFGLFAVTAMRVCYALEDRSDWYVLAFAGACGLGSAYGFLQGAWPPVAQDRSKSRMTVRRLLTDRYLRALPPAPPGQRVEVYDARLPGFGIRVSDTKDVDPSRRGKAGRVAFILYCRFTPGAAATVKISSRRA